MLDLLLLQRSYTWRTCEKRRVPVENVEERTEWTSNEILAECPEKNGDDYKNTAWMGLRFGLQKHFLLKRDFNIINDCEFLNQIKFTKRQLSS